MSISPSSRKRKAWDLNPHNSRGVARFSKPARRTVSGYLPLSVVEPPGIEPGFPVCRTGVFRLDHVPIALQWTAEDLNPDLLVAGQVSCRWTSSPLIKRSVRESNPVPVLTTDVCCRNTYRLSSDPGWNRTSTLLHVTQASSPLDHGIMSVTEAGVEPAKSPRSQRDRFACLRTRPWRVRVSHPAARLMKPH